VPRPAAAEPTETTWKAASLNVAAAPHAVASRQPVRHMPGGFPIARHRGVRYALDLRRASWFGAGRGHHHTGHCSACERASAAASAGGSGGGGTHQRCLRDQLPAEGSAASTSFPANTVTLRSGPSNSCIQTGQGTHDQLAQYLCFAPGDGGTWTFLRNVSTGDQGWVRDALLAGNGSQVPCDTTAPPAGLDLIQTLTGSVAALPVNLPALQPQAAPKADWLGP